MNQVGAWDEEGNFDPSKAVGDDNGHGTHVAGTIGAVADGVGVAGVAPNVAIHSIRMLGADGSGYFSDVLMAVEYVLLWNENTEQPPIRVVNMSLGGPKDASMNVIRDALQKLENTGVVVCIAAGNEDHYSLFLQSQMKNLGSDLRIHLHLKRIGGGFLVDRRLTTLHFLLNNTFSNLIELILSE